MKFNIKVADTTGREWWEPYERDVKDARAWAVEAIARFNDTLRPHEKERTLLEVVIEDESNAGFHRWIKLTAGQSVAFRGSIVDLMQCERCKITGKRYGLSENIKRDSVYRAKKYERCDTALAARREKEHGS